MGWQGPGRKWGDGLGLSKTRPGARLTGLREQEEGPQPRKSLPSSTRLETAPLGSQDVLTCPELGQGWLTPGQMEPS